MTDDILYEGAELVPRPRNGVFGRILDKITPRNIRLNQQLIKVQWETTGEPEIGGETPEQMALSYEREAWIYACVSAIAQDVSGMPAQIKVDGEAYEGKMTSPLDLFEMPNKLDSWADLIFMMTIDLLIFGDAYCYWPGDELLWMPSWQTTPKPDRYDRIGGYIVKGVNGEQKVYDVEEVVHVRYAGPRNMTNGMSPLGPLADTIAKWGLQVATEKNLWKNQTRLGGILTTKQVLTPEVRERELAHWRQQYSGTARAGRTALLSGDLSYQPIGMSMQEAGAADSFKNYRDTVMSVYHVPPTRLGLPEANYALAREQKTGYWLETVLPTAKKIYAAFNRVMFSKLPFRASPDTRDAIYITLAQSALYDMALKATGNKPLMTQNEARTSLLHLPAFEGDESADELNVKQEPMYGAGLFSVDANDAKTRSIGNKTDESRHNEQNTVIGAITTRAIESRKNRHAANIKRETGICKRDVSEPLYNMIEDANIKALEAAALLQKSTLKETGRMLKVADCISMRELDEQAPIEATPRVPDGSDFQTNAAELLQDYMEKAFQRVGGEELAAMENQKRSLRSAMTRETDEELDKLIAEFNVKNPRVIELIQQRVQEFRLVPMNSQQAVRDLIAKAIEEGQSLNEIIDNVRQFFVVNKPWAIARVARTEGGTASNLAANEAMEQARTTKKEWIHSGNPNGRPSHIANENAGEVPFMFVYPNNMRHPMDPRGSAEEIVNCGCTQVATEFEDIQSTAPRPGQTIPLGGF